MLSSQLCLLEKNKNYIRILMTFSSLTFSNYIHDLFMLIIYLMSCHEVEQWFSLYMKLVRQTSTICLQIETSHSQYTLKIDIKKQSPKIHIPFCIIQTFQPSQPKKCDEKNLPLYKYVTLLYLRYCKHTYLLICKWRYGS